MNIDVLETGRAEGFLYASTIVFATQNVIEWMIPHPFPGRVSGLTPTT